MMQIRDALPLMLGNLPKYYFSGRTVVMLSLQPLSHFLRFRTFYNPNLICLSVQNPSLIRSKSPLSFNASVRLLSVWVSYALCLSYCHGNVATQHEPAQMLLKSALHVSSDGYPIGNLKRFKELVEVTVYPPRSKVSDDTISV